MKSYQTKVFLVSIASFLFIYSSTFVNGQTGYWKSHLSYYNTKIVVETPQKIFAVATPYPNAGPKVNVEACGALYAYSPDWQEIKKYSKADGLNDINITHLAYSESEDALLIIYENANIDMLASSEIYNLPFIKDQNIPNKTIYGVDIYGKYAYLSTSLGVIVIDMQKKEIKAQYNLERDIYSVCIKGDYIYTSTSTGIFCALLSKDLVSKDNWVSYNPNISGLDVNNVQKILAFQDGLVYCQYDRGIFYEKGEERRDLFWGSFKKVVVVGGQLVGIHDTFVTFWSDLNNYTRIENLNVFDISSRSQPVFWIAKGSQGLAAIRKEATSNEFSVYQGNVIVNSPKSNNSYSVTFQQGKLLVTGGNSWADNFNIPGTLMVLENGSWYNFDEDKITQGVMQQHQDTIPWYVCRDFIDAAVDPRDPNHYFVSSFGEGLYEFKDNEFVSLYNTSNSLLHPVSATVPNGSLRLGGMTFDKNNNLYMGMAIETINGNSPLFNIFTSDKRWVVPSYKFVDYITPVEKILITSKGQGWITSPRSGKLFIFENNGTIENFSDDQYTFIKGNVKDQKGEAFTFSRCYGVVEDHRGTIWIGTEKGPILFYNPQNATKDPDNFYCTRLILPNNDGTDDGHYLLESEQINTIAIDGANRKWLGTDGSGVYLVSETGMEVLQQFTVENSPLISNKINKIAINPQSGEVFIATDKGLVSYMSDASEGKPDYKEVRVYPNPVRPEFDNLVTVSNLIKDSNVKVADMRGNLIYQGLSKGGMFTWNCTGRNGERVKTGVYLIFAATPDGGEGVVAKVTVVK